MDPVITPVKTVEAAGDRESRADAAVIAAWGDRHAEIFAFLVRTTRDPGAAEDLLQEAFLRLTREVRAGRTPDNIRAWLYRVAANLAVSRGRRITYAFRAIARIGAPPDTLPDGDAPESGYLRREGRGELLAVIDTLEPAARAALLMSAEGFSGAEIATAIGRSEPATRTLLCRTRVRVRGRLESAGIVR